MAGIQDYWEFVDDFIGGGTFGTSASANDPWVITDTSSAGTPTYTRLDHSETGAAYRPGVAQLLFDSQNEVQNLCLSFGDKLAFDIDKVRGAEFGVRLVPGGTLKDSTTTLAFGLTGDRNDAIDSVAIAALFRMAAADATNPLVVESDDGTNDNDDKATGITILDSTWAKFKLDFSQGTKDVRFFGAADSTTAMTRIAADTTFDMSNFTGGLQPFFQIQKSADTNTDAIQIDYIKVWGVR